jgi:hypothetical protein
MDLWLSDLFVAYLTDLFFSRTMASWDVATGLAIYAIGSPFVSQAIALY